MATLNNNNQPSKLGVNRKKQKFCKAIILQLKRKKLKIKNTLGKRGLEISLAWTSPQTEIFKALLLLKGFPGSASSNKPTCQCKEQRVQSLGWEDPLEEGTATHSSILAWRIPGTEKPGRLLFIGYQRVGHDWNDFAKTWVQRNLKAFQVIPICSKALLKLPYAFETHESLSKDSWALCQDLESGLG